MKTYRLTVAYDGTRFHGWQVQPGHRSVQGVIEEALRQVVDRDLVRIAGAGRTDAGVHARGQVCSFRSDAGLPARALAPRLNRVLPADVRIVAAAAAPDGFHARHSAAGRRYAYRLLAADDVLLARYAWWPRRRVDPAALDRATRALEGEHDFSTFKSAGSSAGAPVCRVTRARWRRWEGGVLLDIVADRFLYRMVRAVVGTALAAAAAADPARAMRRALEARDRAAGGLNAPPHGLTLEEVFYPAEAGA